MHIIKYIVLYMVHGDRGSATAQGAADFLPLAIGKRARAGVAEGTAGGGATGDRERPIAGAVAVAGRHAAVPAIGRRFVGGSDGLADETDGARVALLLP